MQMVLVRSRNQLIPLGSLSGLAMVGAPQTCDDIFLQQTPWNTIPSTNHSGDRLQTGGERSCSDTQMLTGYFGWFPGCGVHTLCCSVTKGCTQQTLHRGRCIDWSWLCSIGMKLLCLKCFLETNMGV